MKRLLLPVSVVATAAFLVALNAPSPSVPAGTVEKISAALPAKPFAKPSKVRRVLVFSKTNGFRHQSIPTGIHLLTEMGKKTGAFEVTASEDIAEFEADRLKAYDAVCFLSTTGNVFLPHSSQMKVMSDAEKLEATRREGVLKGNLMRFVREGGAFVGIHAATDTCSEWQEYGKMINGFFDGHPWNAGTDVSIKVEPGQEKHPLVAMMEGANLEFKEEIYQLKDPYDSKAVHMLLRLDTEKTNMDLKGVKRTDKDFGVAWIRHWDKGRVFYCSIGHNHEMYWHPQVVAHYLAGIQWALGDLEAPVSVPK